MKEKLDWAIWAAPGKLNLEKLFAMGVATAAEWRAAGVFLTSSVSDTVRLRIIDERPNQKNEDDALFRLVEE